MHAYASVSDLTSWYHDHVAHTGLFGVSLGVLAVGAVIVLTAARLLFRLAVIVIALAVAAVFFYGSLGNARQQAPKDIEKLRTTVTSPSPHRK